LSATFTLRLAIQQCNRVLPYSNLNPSGGANQFNVNLCNGAIIAKDEDLGSPTTFPCIYAHTDNPKRHHPLLYEPRIKRDEC
jgi:hypothetical protein